MNVQRYFDSFVDDLSLTSTQEKAIQSSFQSFQQIFSDKLCLNDSDVFMQGSYANGTDIRPSDGGEYDVDIMVVSADNNCTADEALTDIFNIVKENGLYTNKVRLRDPCVRVISENDNLGGYHVDLVPSRRTTCGSIAPLEVPRRGNGWHETAPQEYTKWCQDQGRVFQRAVKMLKRWRDVQGGNDSVIKSIVLQVVIAQCLDKSIGSECERIAQLFNAMNMMFEDDLSAPAIMNPVLSSENLSQRWKEEDFKQFKQIVKEAQTISSAAVAASTEVEATEKWQELFGESFPIEKPPEQEIRAIHLGDVSHQKTFIDQHWSISPSKKETLRISGYHYRGLSKKRLHSASELAFPGWKLCFNVISDSALPDETEFWWRVTNTGEHARSKSQLRGTFFQSTDSDKSWKKSQDEAILWEHTAYNGEHLVEAFAVQRGVVIAQSKPFHVKIFVPNHDWRRR
jgi:predicted nucleotidyltransferase